MNLQDQNVLILGLGASGLAMARWCSRQGAAVTVVDTRTQPPALAALQAELPQARFIAGALDASVLQGQGYAAVYKSPGLSPTLIAPIFEATKEVSIRVSCELSLFSEALTQLKESQGYAPHVLAVTGTNGKTTVTALTGQLVARAGKTVAVAGNIGPSLLDTLSKHLDAGTLPEVWVLELSSFQLDAVQGFEPTAGVVLNLTQDHLDWHVSLEAYAAAKARVFGTQGLMVLNRDDAAVMAMLRLREPAPNSKGAGRGRQLRAGPPRVASPLPGSNEAELTPAGGNAVRVATSVGVTFGADMPQRPGDFGLEDVNGMLWLVRALEADETQKLKKGEALELHYQRLMPADALRIRGRHNATNALAALALCTATGCALGPVLYGLREYRGEPHRVQSIGILNGVEFFDDSKGTNVGATVAALNGLGSQQRLVLILGGDGKKQDFSPLAGGVARYARSVILIGRDAPLLQAALADCGVPLLLAVSLPEAVRLANGAAQAGDAVLLSPACASLDMFNNYEHRAQVFVDAVRELAWASGTDLEQVA